MKELKTIKAYENIPFLKSHHAREIRILAEYLEPKARLEKHNVRNTVVFFGSARAVPLDLAQKALRQAQKGDSAEALAAAQQAVRLGRYYEAARELAHKITTWSLSLPKDKPGYHVCSGGGPGIMEAASRGAFEAGGSTLGLNISLPFEQSPNPYITPELLFEFHYFFMRKFWFIYLSKAIVAFPGGFGTMDEVYEALTLLQTRKLQKNIVVLLYGTEFWKENMKIDSMLDWGTISGEDRHLLLYADTPDEAFEKLVAGMRKNGLPV